MYVARHVAVGMQLFTATAARIAGTSAAESPRMRGKRISVRLNSLSDGITPACAGKTIRAAGDATAL